MRGFSLRDRILGDNLHNGGTHSGTFGATIVRINLYSENSLTAGDIAKEEFAGRFKDVSMPPRVGAF